MKCFVFIAALLASSAAHAQNGGVGVSGTGDDFIEFGEKIHCRGSNFWICQEQAGCAITDIQSIICQTFRVESTGKIYGADIRASFSESN